MLYDKLLVVGWNLLLVSKYYLFNELRLIMDIIFKFVCDDILLTFIREYRHLRILKIDLNIAKSLYFSAFSLGLRYLEELIDVNLLRV